jgi:hypothetical protein
MPARSDRPPADVLRRRPSEPERPRSSAGRNTCGRPVSVTTVSTATGSAGSATSAARSQARRTRSASISATGARRVDTASARSPAAPKPTGRGGLRREPVDDGIRDLDLRPNFEQGPGGRSDAYVHSLMGDARPGEVDPGALGARVESLFERIAQIADERLFERGSPAACAGHLRRSVRNRHRALPGQHRRHRRALVARHQAGSAATSSPRTLRTPTTAASR